MDERYRDQTRRESTLDERPFETIVFGGKLKGAGMIETPLLRIPG